MTLLEQMKRYRDEIRNAGREAANEWLATQGLDTGLSFVIRNSFNDNGEPVRTEWRSHFFPENMPPDDLEFEPPDGYITLIVPEGNDLCGGIQPGTYHGNEAVALLRKHKKSPEVIQFIADMLEE